MAIDFKRLFDQAKIPTRNTSKNWVNCNCPFCKNPSDTHFNGGFNVLSPRFNCWRCGSNSYYDALSLLLNIPIHQVSHYLDSYKFVASESEKRKAMAERLDLPGFRLNDNERQYLINRGYDVGYLLNKFHIRGGGIIGDWAYRIIVPIYVNKVLVSWTGRSILDRKMIDELKIPRYKNLSIENSVINPKDTFFNLDNSDGDSVILVEGPFDVMKMGTHTICSLGTSMTREQELLLKTRYKKIFICFDNEPSAQDKGRKVGQNLSAIGMDVELVNACESFNKNDPGELTYDEVTEIKKELNLL